MLGPKMTKFFGDFLAGGGSPNRDVDEEQSDGDKSLSGIDEEEPDDNPSIPFGPRIPPPTSCPQ